MSKITLEQLMALHGLEDGDEFIFSNDGPVGMFVINGCEITRNNLTTCLNAKGCLGEFEITITKKAPWVPKKMDCYHTIDNLCEPSLVKTAWDGDMVDDQRMSLGLVFKTKEQAEARRQELIKWLKESAK